jgi:superfamily II DNA or RNA helicase
MNPTLEAYCDTKPLRPYQETATSAVNAELGRGKRVLLVAPTGAGKSRMSAECMRPAAKGLVLTHTTILREQSKATLPGCHVATIQSLVAKGESGQRRREALKHYDRFFIDEAHHIVGKEWVQLIPHMAHGALFGATATPERSDGTPLGDVFETLIAAAKYSELVTDGFLVPCDIAKPKLSRAQQKKQKVKVDGVAAYLEHGRVPGEANRYRPGIYFAPTIAECQQAVLGFSNAGVRAALVSCDVTGEERQSLFDAYAAGQIDMLCSPMALSEGFDSPRAEVCVLCRSASSLSVYIQMVGRVLRPCTGKERALLIDCTDAASVHGSPTQDRRYSLTGKGIESDIGDEEEEKLIKESAEREAWKLVRIEYEIVRDRLKARFTELQQEATDKAYKPGWVFHRFSEDTALKPPRLLESKYQSTCKHCRTRVKPGEQILWQPEGKVYHRDCWFETLTDEQLTAYQESQHG